MTAPLTPPDCDLRGMPFMPMDTIRVLDSDMFALATGEEFKAAFALWCKSWHQVPAGSLPDDDRILAFLSGARDTWCDMSRDIIMRGWIKCSDGRLYHPVVCEKALEALPQRREYQSKRAADNERKERERQDRRAIFAALKAIGITPEYSTKTAELRRLAQENNVTISHSDMSVTGHTHVTAKRETVKGEGEGYNNSSDTNVSGADAPIDPSIIPDPAKVMFDAGRRLFAEHGIPKSQAGSLLGKWRKHHGDEAVIVALGRAHRAGPSDIIEFMEGIFRHAQRANGRGFGSDMGSTEWAFRELAEELGIQDRGPGGEARSPGSDDSLGATGQMPRLGGPGRHET
ncbi:DUF1376 domain-containing protein [Sphingobium phenoxybenzoativorans]|uniref:DUF1376 domain-containing protein n=1 Tax=Sphingobium phenoxybenzoativorans TaxID=1592790 RepID=A0A975Q051_9SPHN|nr:DUF1376 domain-containing protein [Sphingobium phenoxybenzoativorans]QUT04033.1 DUF1376 domain-containing protein [Sphingobium phenoxybenzoativorans]